MSTTIPARQVRTRRIEFEYPTAELPRHYAGGDLVMSHVITVLSSLFPEGEDFFVRTVRNYRHQITDPELTSQVAGFIGQEAMHGREHRAFNERLAELGYPTRVIDRLTGIGLRFGERVLPKPVQLAITAALEHYTATIAEVLLTDEQARANLDIDEIRSLLVWHALEESEHRAVAFDVYESVSGNHWIRVGVMNAVTVGFLLAVAAGTALSLLRDPAARDLRRLRQSLARGRRSPFVSKAVRHRIRDYNRRGFHPDDHDNTAIVAEWRNRLFGDAGTLVPRLKQTA